MGDVGLEIAMAVDLVISWTGYAAEFLADAR